MMLKILISPYYLQEVLHFELITVLKPCGILDDPEIKLGEGTFQE